PSASRIASTNPSSRRGTKPSSHQTASTWTTPSAASIRGSKRPTRRSRKTIGRTYQPHRRFAGGTYSSHTYSKSNSSPSSFRSQTSGSYGEMNATDGGGSGGAWRSSTSARTTKCVPRTPSMSTGTSSPSSTSSFRSSFRPGKSGSR